jgi:drug/metabolite transporter (DMT)-like permease
MNNYLKGSLLVLLTAFISGVSVYINKYGVTNIDATLFTALKNSLVGLLFIVLISLSHEWSVLKSLTKKQLLQLGGVGVLGGSIPFVLFFHGLQLTSNIKAGFIHKTMFVYVALLAFIFLKEKLFKRSLVGLVAVILGLIIFLKIKPQALALGDLLVLMATLLWSIEIIISKKLLFDIPVNLVVLARMGFGAVCIWIYLLWQGGLQQISQLDLVSWQWVGLTAVLLFAYVYTFYHGLKYIPANFAAVILSIGAPITALLSLGFVHKSLALVDFIGIGVIVFGIFLVYKRQTSSTKTYASSN